MNLNININKDLIKYEPFQHYVEENILNKEFAIEIQNEILSISDEKWDRYDNPFEQKFTLRDKHNFPRKCMELFNYLESNEFIEYLSEIVGYKLIRDEYRNFWGIHKYNDGDYLDIHVDAGIHPNNKLKKQLTLGIYFSKDWKEENLGHLELWKGSNAGFDNAEIFECKKKILPKFNTLILFECNDFAWHGNPTKINIKNGEKRIFLTISYLSENFGNINKRQKAFFVKRPEDEDNEEKDKLKFLRADPEKYKEIYKYS
jgi:hypothetical protein